MSFMQSKLFYLNYANRIICFVLSDNNKETYWIKFDSILSLIRGIAVQLAQSGSPNVRLCDCLDCHSSTLQESQISKSGLYPVYGATGISGHTESFDISGEAILIVKDGSGVGSVKFADGEYSYIGTLNRLTSKNGYCLKFLYFALKYFNFEPYKTGMAIPHIYFKDYGKAKIYCPPLAEQKCVANVLDKLESKLFVEQELLASFNQHKQYLLQQMFI